MKYLIIFLMFTALVYSSCKYQVRKIEATNDGIRCTKEYILRTCVDGFKIKFGKIKEFIPHKCANFDWSKANTYYRKDISYETSKTYSPSNP